MKTLDLNKAVCYYFIAESKIFFNYFGGQGWKNEEKIVCNFIGC